MFGVFILGSHMRADVYMILFRIFASPDVGDCLDNDVL